ncbi:MAG: choice-of-anchor L domain-containing protein [Bacteroidia bacterium]
MAFNLHTAKNVIIALLLLVIITPLQAQLVVDTTYTPEQLVHNILLSNSVTVSNITYTGANRAIGYFDGTRSNIGLTDGILMTTGSVEVAARPYNPLDRGIINDRPGDAALSAISGDSTYDACILQFDFVPYADTVSFDFAFGSEEYSLFTCCEENDVFAFFISGPGITGTQNIAVVPGTTIPISISSINGNWDTSCEATTHRCVGTCCSSNPQYYINNTSGTTVGYAGFTTIMKAESPVICGQQYHIKLAIADAVDSSYDSGVFLGGHSFRGGTIPLNISAVPIDSVCPNDKVTVYFPDNNPNDMCTWTFSGANVLSGSNNGPYILSWGTSGPKQIGVVVTGPCMYDRDSVTINVNPCDIVVPNIFTPGSGNINSTFSIINLDKYPNSNLQIFNRWGDMIYYSTNYQNDWTGDNEPDGTYFYIITLENLEVKKGFVTIVRK